MQSVCTDETFLNFSSHLCSFLDDRATAASGIKNLSETKSGKIFDALIGDSDAGIRKVTLNASAHFTSKKMMTKLSNLAKVDPEPMLRELANKNLAKMEKK